MVMDEGADGMSSLEISDAFDMLGSNFSIHSDTESVNLGLQSLTENFETSMDIFSKVLLNPDFNNPDFKREKKKIITRLMQLRDEPDYLAEQIFELRLFGSNNPYAFPTLGYDDEIDLLKNENIKDFYSRKFSPEVSNLVAVGSLNFDTLIEVLENKFSNWKRPTDKVTLTGTKSANRKMIFLFDKKDSVQSEIRIGHTSQVRNSKDYFQRLILNTVLGGQFTSRINLNLRENKGYTYGAFSHFSYLKEEAYFYVSTSVGIENTVNAIKEIYSELEKIQEGITDDELEFAKSSIIRNFPSNFETYRQITNNLSSRVLHNLPDDYFNTYIDNVYSVKSEQIKIAAQKFINPDNALCVIVGDKDKLYGPFTKYGIRNC
jgi:zinc protease